MAQSADAFKISTIFFICATIVLLSIVGGIAHYYTQDRQLMSKNIQDAITKGIDPMSVRCSYASETDTVCVAYAYSTHGVPKTIPEVPISIRK